MIEVEGSLPRGGALGREELLARIGGEPPLISRYLSIEEQLQPNGFDLSLAEIGVISGKGAIGTANGSRKLPIVVPLAFESDGWVDLPPGAYQIVFNEIVDVPNDLMALGRPRSSLCRMGATIVTAVWDAGYRGRSTALLVISNIEGVRVQRDARLMQLVFFTLNAATAEGYRGAYQNENLASYVPPSSIA